MRWKKPLLALVATGLAAVLTPAVWTCTVSASHNVVVAQVPPGRTVIVFGAALDPETGEPLRFLGARLDLAIELYRLGKTQQIVVSGATGPYYSEPRSMRRYLEKAGVPSEIIVQDDHGYDTYDTCIRARDVFHLTNPVLATQSYHLPRAVAICRTLGVDALGVADDTVRKYRTHWWLGVGRELGANWKMIYDLATHRPPLVEE